MHVVIHPGRLALGQSNALIAREIIDKVERARRLLGRHPQHRLRIAVRGHHIDIAIGRAQRHRRDGDDNMDPRHPAIADQLQRAPQIIIALLGREHMQLEPLGHLAQQRPPRRDIEIDAMPPIEPHLGQPQRDNHRPAPRDRSIGLANRPPPRDQHIEIGRPQAGVQMQVDPLVAHLLETNRGIERIIKRPGQLVVDRRRAVIVEHIEPGRAKILVALEQPPRRQGKPAMPQLALDMAGKTRSDGEDRLARFKGETGLKPRLGDRAQPPGFAAPGPPPDGVVLHVGEGMGAVDGPKRHCTTVFRILDGVELSPISPVRLGRNTAIDSVFPWFVALF